MQTSLSSEEKEYIIDEARYGELESLQQIFEEVSHDLIPEILDDSRNSVLHMAAGNGHTKILEFVISMVEQDRLKLFVDFQNSSGNTALHWAALNGQLESVKLLCEKYDADVFVRNNEGHDAIFMAERDQKEDVVNYFLAKYSFDPEDEEEEAPVFSEGKEIEQLTEDAKNVDLDAEKGSESKQEAQE